jgi:hypothetical protein
MRMIIILLLAGTAFQLVASPANACPPGYIDCGRGVCCPGR